MKHTLLGIRDKIIWDFWEKNKNEIPMMDQCQIFNLTLSSYYRIIKEQTEKHD